jgi:hypothetical protein
VLFASELEATLREFDVSATIEVRESGRVARFSRLSWEVRGSGEKPLLHLWSEEYNVTRRVLAIADHSEQRLALAVERFARSKPDQLEFIRVESDPSERESSRQAFCGRFSRLLAEQFPDETLESLTTASDLEHSLSGSYARGLLRRGSSYWAILGVSDGESADAIDNSLTFALLWLERARECGRRGTLCGLRVILPVGASQTVAHRFGALDLKVNVELYELDPLRELMERRDPRSAGNIDSWLVPQREAQSLLASARAALEPILALAPQSITVHPTVAQREVWLRFRGLAIARWHEGRIFFGAMDPRQPLTADSRAQLAKLIHELETCRHPRAGDRRHPLYRAQAERWLESLVREDVTRIDASLDARFVYAQVFANSGGEHGILDVLTITRNGRLAILELKAGEHIHLPLQAADYWLRVRRHMERGDFSRFGYFGGIELQNAAPIVYLVAPAMRFHPSTDALLTCLSPDLEVVRVGLAESWRRGLRVVMRQ